MTPSPVPAPHPGIDRVLRAIADHGEYRSQCIGLVPTENRVSPLAHDAMASDLGHLSLIHI